MVLQDRRSVWDFRAERVFIYYSTVLLLEDGWCDPSSKPLSAGKRLSGDVDFSRFQHEPSTNVNAADLVIGPVEANTSPRKWSSWSCQLPLL